MHDLPRLALSVRQPSAWAIIHGGKTIENRTPGAIIGSVEVTDIITTSDSEWFGGSAGLLLDSPRPVELIPATGALGYFEWRPGGQIAPAKRWMMRFDVIGGDDRTLPRFPDAEPSYETPPAKPVRKG